MDFEFIERVVKLVEEAEIGELELEQEGLRILVKKSPTGGEMGMGHAMMMPQMPYYASPQQPIAPQDPVTQVPEEDNTIEVVKAPMVGTFYRAPSPETPSFVEVGSSIQASSVVCILEAMKVMNEIKAGVSGTIVEILVENGQPVEYGQALFKVKKT